MYKTIVYTFVFKAIKYFELKLKKIEAGKQNKNL